MQLCGIKTLYFNGSARDLINWEMNLIDLIDKLDGYPDFEFLC